MGRAYEVQAKFDGGRRRHSRLHVSSNKTQAWATVSQSKADVTSFALAAAPDAIENYCYPPPYRSLAPRVRLRLRFYSKYAAANAICDDVQVSVRAGTNIAYARSQFRKERFFGECRVILLWG